MPIIYFIEECQLDLHGIPVQYREIQGYESHRFLSYFPRFVSLQGGVSTGFHHVSSPPPLDLHRLFRISLSHQTTGRPHLQVREVVPEGSSLVAGDVFVLDKGSVIWQFNTKASAGQEKFKAAEFVQSLVNDRQGQSDVTVYGKQHHYPQDPNWNYFCRRRRSWRRHFFVRVRIGCSSSPIHRNQNIRRHFTYSVPPI